MARLSARLPRIPAMPSMHGGASAGRASIGSAPVVAGTGCASNAIQLHAATDLSLLTNKFATMLIPSMFEHTAEAATLSQVHYNWGSAGIEALRILHEGRSLLLCGAAGSGKTTLVMQYLISLLLEGRLQPVGTRPRHEYLEEGCIPEHKSLKKGSPSFIACALAHKVKQRLMLEFPPKYTYTFGGVDYEVSVTNNIMTAHRACEYKPVKMEIETDEGDTVEKRRFMPTRGADNILPDITHVFCDEGGMLPLQTFYALATACPKAQVVIMSDIGQLGAVAGLSALEPALAYGTSVELKTIYRNQGAILEFAFAVRAGEHYRLRRTRKVQHYVTKSGNVDKSIAFMCYEKSGDDDPKSEISAEFANAHCTKIMFQLITNDMFVPGVDMCLCPQRPDSSGNGITSDNASGDVRFGINAIYPALAQMLDTHYGRHTYYISTKKGPLIVAAGDIYYVDSDQGGQLEYMLVGLTENTNFVSAVSRPARRYTTRVPYVWDSMLQAETAAEGRSVAMPTDVLDLQDYMDAIFDDSTAYGGGSKAETGEDTRSQYTLHFINLTALRTSVFGKVANKKDAYTLLRYIVKELFNLALLLDNNQNTTGYTMTQQDVETEVSALLRRVHLDNVEDDLDDSGESLLLVVNKTSKIAAMLPAVPITIHKSQGSEAEMVVLLLHNSCRQLNREMLYTGQTRSRESLIVVCNADTFGECVSDTTGEIINTAKYRKPCIDRVGTAGVTLEEKSATIKARLDGVLTNGEDSQRSLVEWARDYFEGDEYGRNKLRS